LDLVRVADDDDIDRLIDEIKIMCSLDHPNIVCLEEVYEGARLSLLRSWMCSTCETDSECCCLLAFKGSHPSGLEVGKLYV
jgi:hypothetical protein